MHIPMMASRIDNASRQRRMVALLKALAPDQGYTLTPLPRVRFLRSDRPLASTPVLYEPGIVVVCQGSKRGLWGDRVYRYDAQHYLAVSVPVPFTMETDASAEAPLLAIYFELDFRVAAELMLQLDQLAGASRAEPVGMLSTPMDDRLANSVLRFLQAMASPVEAQVIGPALVREIYFHALIGEQGPTLRAALAREGRFGRVSKAVRKIHADYADALDVECLAGVAGMSVPSFHAHFKAVTAASPMQYLKSIRLHQARLSMLREGTTAASAALQVGYESSSQFSREFKRLFGRSPRAEVTRMKADFAMPAPTGAQAWVTSH